MPTNCTTENVCVISIWSVLRVVISADATGKHFISVLEDVRDILCEYVSVTFHPEFF